MDRTCIRELEKIWLPDGYLVHNPITFISVEAGGKRGEKNCKKLYSDSSDLVSDDSVCGSLCHCLEAYHLELETVVTNAI